MIIHAHRRHVKRHSRIATFVSQGAFPYSSE